MGPSQAHRCDEPFRRIHSKIPWRDLRWSATDAGGQQAVGIVPSLLYRLSFAGECLPGFEPGVVCSSTSNQQGGPQGIPPQKQAAKCTHIENRAHATRTRWQLNVAMASPGIRHPPNSVSSVDSQLPESGSRSTQATHDLTATAVVGLYSCSSIHPYWQALDRHRARPGLSHARAVSLLLGQPSPVRAVTCRDP